MMKLKIGDFVSDGYKTYVFDNYQRLVLVDSGCHADYLVTHDQLVKMLKDN